MSKDRFFVFDQSYQLLSEHSTQNEAVEWAENRLRSERKEQDYFVLRQQNMIRARLTIRTYDIWDEWPEESEDE